MNTRTDNAFDFSDLEDDVDADGNFNPKQKKTDNTQKFPCGQCAGTGRYQGARVHQQKSHCFACRGTGYFKTDPRKLKQARQAAQTRKAKEVSENILQNRATVEALAEVAHWNDFCEQAP